MAGAVYPSGRACSTRLERSLQELYGEVASETTGLTWSAREGERYLVRGKAGFMYVSKRDQRIPADRGAEVIFQRMLMRLLPRQMTL